MTIKTVESLKKGLELLEAFSAHSSDLLSLQEITEISGMPKATAYRFIQTLVSLDYLHYFPNSRAYRLGPKVMSLGFASLSAMDIGSVAQPYLEELSRRIDQNVNLGVLDGNEVVYIIRIKRRRILGIDLSVGSRLNAYNTAIGRMILAFEDVETVDAIIHTLCLNPEVEKEIGPDGTRLRETLTRIRECGYSLIDDEYITGLRSVAVPIFAGNGKIEASVNVPVFSQFCSTEKLLTEYLPQVREVADTISRLRG